MLTHIDIDQEKVDEIMSLKNFKTKKEAVNTAIEEYLKSIRRMEVLKWKGTDFWEGDLNEMRAD